MKCSLKNIVKAYNKIFGIIDNQILLLKYEYQGEVKWNEIYRISILTNFFFLKSSSILNIHYMQLKYQEGLLWNIILAYQRMLWGNDPGIYRLFVWIYPGDSPRHAEICTFRDTTWYYWVYIKMILTLWRIIYFIFGAGREWLWAEY